MTNKRQTYSEETLQEAVRLCNEEGMSYGEGQTKKKEKRRNNLRNLKKFKKKRRRRDY